MSVICAALSSARYAFRLFEIGWEDACANAFATERTSLGSDCKSKVKPGRVNVPVLSSMTVCTSASRSSAVPDFTKKPMRYNRLIAAVETAGTARPRAQGQVMIRTAMATFNEWRRSWVAISHPMKVTAAKRCTAGA